MRFGRNITLLLLITLALAGLLIASRYLHPERRVLAGDAIFPMSPETITSIGVGAFNKCTGLTSVIFEGTPKIETINNYAFEGRTALTSFTVPASVKTIGDYSFANCTSLTSLTVSEGVTSIGAVAFTQCTALETLVLPASLETIGDHAFSGCGNLYLNGVTVPAGSVAETYVKEVMKLTEKVE
jgi:hypothetical protein